MKVFNTLSRKLETVEPLEAGHVGLYTCGPTVYDYAHIGNFRAYMFEDLLRRQLKAEGYDVCQVMNLTDVDDKTIRGANGQGVALTDYTKTYVDAFFADLKTLNIEAAEHYPAATDHIPEMIDLVQRLLDAGYAYASDDGSVYFNVGKFASYGRLAHLDMDGLQAGARVAQDEYEKENVADFALWKAWSEEDGPVAWDSPWGRGRPGWHIECSAMSIKYLGESFDIHTGGIDNMFPHHENEIAQAEGATGKPFVKYWLHCAHLRVDGQKMAKSLGNFYRLNDLTEKGYSGREIRYVLLSAHYRQTLNFTLDSLDSARASLARLDEFRLRLLDVADGHTPQRGGTPPEWAASGQQTFSVAMQDDLNSSEALAALFDMVHAGHKAMDSGTLTADGAAAALGVLESLDDVLGVLQSEDVAPDADVEALLDERQAARGAKDWAESDRIRDALAALGWEVKDTPDGQKVRRVGA